MEYFLTFFEQYKGHATHVVNQSTESAKNVRSEGNVATAETTFRRLIERFANGAPTQSIIDAVDQLYTDANNDPELKGWFTKLNTYIRKCLQEPGFIMKDEANTQARQLRDSGKKFFVAAEGRSEGKYKPHADALFREIAYFGKSMHSDPLNRKLSANVQQITKDLFLNSEGGLTFKPHLWSDIRDPILPELLSHVGLVPLPRIEYTDKQVDLVIENLAIDLLNILPSQIEMDIRNHFKLSQFDKLGDRHQHSFKLTLHQVQTDMRDVHFFFNKKMGFPKLNERGTADVFLGGKGLTVTVHLEAENAPRGKKSRHIFTVKQVVAKVDKLKFAIRDSKHDTLIKILRPLATGIIKKQISKAAEQGIRDALEDLDRQLWSCATASSATRPSRARASPTPSRRPLPRTTRPSPRRATARSSSPRRSATRSCPTSATPTAGSRRWTSATRRPSPRRCLPLVRVRARSGTRPPSRLCSRARRTLATRSRPSRRTSAPRPTTRVSAPTRRAPPPLELPVRARLVLLALPVLRVLLVLALAAFRLLLPRVLASRRDGDCLLDGQRLACSWRHRCRYGRHCDPARQRHRRRLDVRQGGTGDQRRGTHDC